MLGIGSWKLGVDYSDASACLHVVVIRLVARVLEHFAMADDAVRSMTKTARLAMSFRPIMSGLTTPYLRITSLL